LKKKEEVSKGYPFAFRKSAKSLGAARNNEEDQGNERWGGKPGGINDLTRQNSGNKNLGNEKAKGGGGERKLRQDRPHLQCKMGRRGKKNLDNISARGRKRSKMGGSPPCHVRGIIFACSEREFALREKRGGESFRIGEEGRGLSRLAQHKVLKRGKTFRGGGLDMPYTP